MLLPRRRRKAMVRAVDEPRRSPRFACALAVVVLLLPVVAGCARARAKTIPDAPTALDVPLPPPRLVEPLDVEAAPPARLPDESPARPVAARPRPTPPAPAAPAPGRQEPPKAEAPKPAEAPPAEVPKVVEEAPKPAPPATPPTTSTTLQTTPAGAEGEVERSIRTTLSRAASDLSRVDYRVLNADARTQYDTAKRFIQQAEEAGRAKNLVFAKNLAEKAAALAAQLAGK